MQDKVNERIERVTKLTYFYHCELFVVIGTVSAIIQTIVNHYIKGLGDDAFYLPTLIVYVC